MPLRFPRPSRPGLRAFSGLLLEAVKEFMRDRCHALGAALAFYAALSAEPFVLLVLTVPITLLGQEAVRERVMPLVADWLGPQGARITHLLLARFQGGGISLHAIEVLGLTLGATGFFGQLKDSLETIWGVRREELGLKKVKKTVIEVVLTLACALVILFSLVSKALFMVMIERPAAERVVSWGKTFWLGAEQAAFFGFLCLVFAALFKLLPETRLTWRDVFPGAVFTSLVYMPGRWLAAHYLARYGGAGGGVSTSLIFLLWIYYTSQVFLFGAEFTRLYTERYGSLRRPEGGEDRS